MNIHIYIYIHLHLYFYLYLFLYLSICVSICILSRYVPMSAFLLILLPIHQSFSAPFFLTFPTAFNHVPSFARTLWPFPLSSSPRYLSLLLLLPPSSSEIPFPWSDYRLQHLQQLSAAFPHISRNSRPQQHPTAPHNGSPPQAPEAVFLLLSQPQQIASFRYTPR